jgi:hypothetical protein
MEPSRARLRNKSASLGVLNGKIARRGKDVEERHFLRGGDLDVRGLINPFLRQPALCGYLTAYLNANRQIGARDGIFTEIIHFSRFFWGNGTVTYR